MIDADGQTFEERLAGLRAAAEPTRLRVLRLLGRAELTVTELTVILGQSQPNVSRHLRVLCEAGLVARHQEGAFVFYRRAPGAFVPALGEGLSGPVPEADDEALGAVLDERARAAQAYFAERAAQWDDLRTHYVGHAGVEATLRGMVEADPPERLIDLGTGTGRVLIALAGAYGQAVGYDVSPEMLAVARVRLHEAGIGRARVRRGDLMALDEQDADLVVLHHVLHFLLRPDEAVAAAARLLGPGGRILIADFAPHTVEALRERHAHQRLGFASDEVARFAARAGLAVREEETVAGETGDLTTKLWMLGEADRPVRRKDRRHVPA